MALCALKQQEAGEAMHYTGKTLECGSRRAGRGSDFGDLKAPHCLGLYLSDRHAVYSRAPPHYHQV